MGADDEKVKMVVDQLAGKNIEELLRKARASLAACQLPELPPQLLLQLPVEQLLQLLLPRWRKRKKRKTMTWDSVSSTRTFPLQQSTIFSINMCSDVLRRSTLLVIVVAFEIYNYH